VQAQDANKEDSVTCAAEVLLTIYRPLAGRRTGRRPVMTSDFETDLMSAGRLHRLVRPFPVEVSQSEVE